MLFGSNAPDRTVDSTTHSQAMFSAQPFHEALLRCKEARCRRYQQWLISHGIAFFLPALPYQPFPLEGFDFCRTLTFAGLCARLFLFRPIRLVTAF